jgi:hypothetical protein
MNSIKNTSYRKQNIHAEEYYPLERNTEQLIRTSSMFWWTSTVLHSVIPHKMAFFSHWCENLKLNIYVVTTDGFGLVNGFTGLFYL